jgi:hypothetical protein
MDWTAEQVLALAPDSGSASSGRGLAKAKDWQNSGQHQGVIWGECQGSGKTPYQTRVLLAEPAFKCTCPSRKFPCKHAIGLFLLHVATPLTAAAPPGWVADWLASRGERAEKQSSKAEAAAAKAAELAADPAAAAAAEAERLSKAAKSQGKSQAERERKVAAGLAELQLWLYDLLRGGLASAQNRPHSQWETAAARLVDAQAPGLARLLRELPGAIHSGDGWTERTLWLLGKLHLAIEGYKNQANLSAGLRADVRGLIGFVQSQEEVLAGPSVTDIWQVIGASQQQQEQLEMRRTWLLGESSGKSALLLDFRVGNQVFAPVPPLGTRFRGELAFFASNYPQRALLRAGHQHVGMIEPLAGLSDFEAALGQHAQALAAQPWLERSIWVLEQIQVVNDNGQLYWRDRNGQIVAVGEYQEQVWPILTISAGMPFVLIGEWQHDALTPLAFVFEGWQRLAGGLA